jgi:hypothetical protein
MPRAYGGDRIEETEGELVLFCDKPKGWIARREKTPLTPEHPGTAVLWDGSPYEVVEAVSLSGGLARYTLAVWDERHAIRVAARYDEDSEMARAGERSDTGRRHRRYGEILLAAPLMGLLPDDVQQRFEREYGTPASLLTLSSALPLFLFGVFSMIALLVRFLGAADLLPLPIIVIGYYFFIESAIRLGVVLGQGRSVGSLPGEILWVILQKVRGQEVVPVARQGSLPGEAASWDSYLVLEPFLSFLAPADQAAVERRFGFEPPRWGRITALFLLFAFVPLFLAAFSGVVLVRQASDVPLLLVTGYLCVEQLERLRRVRRGEAAPSVLRVFVKPFAKRLLSAVG